MGEYLKPRNPDSFRELRFLDILFTLVVSFCLCPLIAQEEEAIINEKPVEKKEQTFKGFAERRSR